ncbi:beta tubulin [bacterium endosymbiont of Escarpia laminata]|nr:MAG: beta tubulin [bacterium endosymbiont of Escarpia laminata]
MSVTTRTTIWDFTLLNSEVKRFTEFDRDLTVGGQTYQSAYGYIPSAIQKGVDASTDNMETSGPININGVDEDDLRAGLYDAAKVKIRLVDWIDPDGQPQYILLEGRLGKVTHGDDAFKAELLGLTKLLQQTIGRSYLPTCDADLGDARCGVTVTPVAVTVTATTSLRLFEDSTLGQADDHFTTGLLTWQTGGNAGFKADVKRFLAGGSIELYEPAAYDIYLGDTALIQEGCDKTKDTCRDRFNNIINYRGFPFIPGMSEVLRGVS